LVEAALVRRTIRSPPEEYRWKPGPSAGIKIRDSNLTDQARREAAPWWDRIMLPSRTDSCLLGACFGEKLCNWSSQFARDRTTDSEVMQKPVRVSKSEDKLRRVGLTRNTYDHTVHGALSLDLDPIADATLLISPEKVPTHRLKRDPGGLAA
jgi:hypothetical protein